MSVIKLPNDRRALQCARILCRYTNDIEAKAELKAIMDLGSRLKGHGIGSYDLMLKLADDGYPLYGYGIEAKKRVGVYSRYDFLNHYTGSKFSAYIDEEPLRPVVFFGYDFANCIRPVNSVSEALSVG